MTKATKHEHAPQSVRLFGTTAGSGGRRSPSRILDNYFLAGCVICRRDARGFVGRFAQGGWGRECGGEGVGYPMFNSSPAATIVIVGPVELSGKRRQATLEHDFVV